MTTQKEDGIPNCVITNLPVGVQLKKLTWETTKTKEDSDSYQNKREFHSTLKDILNNIHNLPC